MAFRVSGDLKNGSEWLASFLGTMEGAWSPWLLALVAEKIERSLYFMDTFVVSWIELGLGSASHRGGFMFRIHGSNPKLRANVWFQKCRWQQSVDFNPIRPRGSGIVAENF